MAYLMTTKREQGIRPHEAREAIEGVPDRRASFCPGKPGGFSLVEITLALGIIVFVMVALIGLLSNGMRISQSSRSDLMAAEIASRFLAERGAAPTTNLVNNPIDPLTNATTTGLKTALLTSTGDVTSANAYFIMRYEVEPVPSLRSYRVSLALSHPAVGTANSTNLATADQTYETTSYIRVTP